MAKRRANKKVRQQRGSAGCMGVIALVFLGIASAFAFNTWSFNQRAIVTEAIVIDVQINRSSDGEVTYLPTFGFPTAEGPVEASPKMAADAYDYDIGDTVEIRYDPDEPTHALPTGTIGPWLVSMILGALGAIPLVIAVLTLIASIRNDRRAST